MKKKAQATLFMIIATLVLVVAAVSVYIIQEKAEEITPEIGIAEKIPAELEPVKMYVETCIGEILADGIKTLGEHGGYIYQDSFDVNTDPTEGNAIEYYPNSKFYVPYWYYMKSNNYCVGNCEFTAEMMPQLCKPGRNCITTGTNSIEKQLDEFIKNSLGNCLDDFKPFKEQGINVIEIGDINADTIIKDKEVIVIVDYQLKVEKQDMTGKITRFIKSIDSDLSEMYEIAYDIVDYETQKCFIGDHVRNYYSYYFGLGRNDLPPIYEATVGTSKTTEWNIEDVKKNLKSKTSNALRMLGVFNTSGFVWPTVPSGPYYNTRQGVYDQFVSYPMKRFHAATVNMFYFNWWDPFLDIKPSDGNRLVPTDIGGGGGGIMSIIGRIAQTKIYEFFYQYSFPVVVEVRKKDRLGREHLFRFAIESNIRANKCFNANATLIHSASAVQTILCDKDQMANNISITVKDKNKAPLEDVAVSFFAGQSCQLGVTDSNGKLEASYPKTYGGFLKLEKEDYVAEVVHQPDLGDRLEVELQKFRHFDAAVKKYSMAQPDACCGAAEDLTETEQIIISLNKVTDPNEPLEQELQQPMMFSGNDETTLVYDIKLVPGEYEIDATYIDNEEYTIKPGCMKICSGYDWKGDCDEYQYLPEESQSIKPTGGAVLDNETGYWQIGESDLEGKSSVEFYVLRVPDSNCISTDDCILSPCIGLEEFDKVGNYSESFRSFIIPKFK